MRRIKFSKHQLKGMAQQARKMAEANGTEICGLIVNNGDFCELIRVRNKTKRGGGFSFYFGEIRAIQKVAEKCKHEIVGTFHSHPVGLPAPGPSDIANAVDDSLMLIYDVTGRSVKLWHINRQKAKSLRYKVV
jgi:proteasome lid subunit RPN8/RPN11